MEQELSLKKRAPNYTSGEKEHLLNIMVDYKHIIENKKTDGVSVKEKKETWQKVCEEFNTASPNLHYRPVESLKKYYDKLKEDLRKRCANTKKELYKTGGGPELKDDEKGDEILMSIVNKKSFKGLGSRFDSNSGQLTYNIEEHIETCREPNDLNIIETLGVDKLPCEYISEEAQLKQGPETKSRFNEIEVIYESKSPNPSQSLVSETQMESDWKKAENLKRPISYVLQKNVQKTYTTPVKRVCHGPSRRRPNSIVPLTSSRLGEKYELLIDKKLELVEYSKKEHKLKIQSLELDILLKKKQLAQL